jgi:hypothetical protein
MMVNEINDLVAGRHQPPSVLGACAGAVSTRSTALKNCCLGTSLTRSPLGRRFLSPPPHANLDTTRFSLRCGSDAYNVS